MVWRVNAFSLALTSPLAVMKEEKSREPLQVLRWFINICLNMKLSRPSVAITYLLSSLSKILSTSWPLSELTERSFSLSNTEHPLSDPIILSPLCIPFASTQLPVSYCTAMQWSICHRSFCIVCPGVMDNHRNSSLEHVHVLQPKSFYPKRQTHKCVTWHLGKNAVH